MQGRRAAAAAWGGVRAATLAAIRAVYCALCMHGHLLEDDGAAEQLRREARTFAYSPSATNLRSIQAGLLRLYLWELFLNPLCFRGLCSAGASAHPALYFMLDLSFMHSLVALICGTHSSGIIIP